MKKNSELYILSNGRVAAISKKDGSIIWEVKLKQYLSNSTTLHFGQIMVENDKLYIGASGILLCLNRKDGSLIWKNELKGWGYNYISMADVSNDLSGSASANSSANASAAIIAASV